MEFYTYQLRLEDSEFPFYVGKGKGKRLLHHLMPFSLSRKSLKNSIIKKAIANGVAVIPEILKMHETEGAANTEEIRLIALYGRRDNGTGILANHTDGGDGSSGVVRDDTYKKAMSEKLSGRTFTDRHREHISESKAGTIVVRDFATGMHVSIKSSEYREDKVRYGNNVAGKVPTRNAAGDVVMVDPDDPRLSTGELVHNSKGKPGPNTGKKFSESTRKNMSIVQWKKSPEVWGAAGNLARMYDGIPKKNAYQLSKVSGFKESSLAAICKRLDSGWVPSNDPSWIDWVEMEGFLPET